MEPIHLTWSQWATIAAGGFTACTLAGFIHDNYWDPEIARARKRERSMSQRPKRKHTPRTEYEKSKPHLQGEELLKALIGHVDQLQSRKKNDEAELYMLRLVTLAEELPQPPKEAVMLISYFLSNLLKHYRTQKKHESVEMTACELLSLNTGSEFKTSEKAEWQLALMEACIHLSKYSDAIEEGREILKKFETVDLSKERNPQQEAGVIQQLMFMVHEKMGDAYAKMKQFKNAEDSYNSAIDSCPANLVGRAITLKLDVAQMYFLNGMEEKGEQVLDKMQHGHGLTIKENRDHIKLRGMTYFEVGLLAKAESIFQRALDDLPPIEDLSLCTKEEQKDVETFNAFLASVKHALGKHDEARAIYAAIKANEGMYSMQTSTYFQTSAVKFVPTDKDERGEASAGTWTLVLTVRELPSGLARTPLQEGHFIEVAVERFEGGPFIEEIEEVNDKKKGKAECLDSDGKAVIFDKIDVPVTSAMCVPHSTIEISTAKTVAPACPAKAIVEITVYKDKSKTEKLAVHAQAVMRQLKSQQKPKFDEDMMNQFLASQMDPMAFR